MANEYASHEQEVRAFLARSSELGRRIEEQVAAARAHLGRSPQPVRSASRRAEPLASRVDDVREAGLHERMLAMGKALEVASEELRLARCLVEREHAKHTDAFESEPVPTLITDARAAVRAANRAAATELGVEPESLPGRLLVAFVARQDVARFRDFARPLWDDLRDDVRSVTVRIRPRGRAVVRARLSVHVLRSATRRNVGLKWTIVWANDTAASLV